MTAWMREAKEGRERLAEAQRNEVRALGEVLKYKKLANDMRAVATRAVDLLRLLATATDVRPHPGIYFLLDAAQEILYVGKSDNVLCRMAGHREKGLETVRMIRVDDPAERDRLEPMFIHFLEPRLNTALMAHNHVRRTIAAAEWSLQE